MHFNEIHKQVCNTKYVSIYVLSARLEILHFLGLGIHLFVKVPRPGNSEESFTVFESSCHLLLPV